MEKILSGHKHYSLKVNILLKANSKMVSEPKRFNSFFSFLFSSRGKQLQEITSITAPMKSVTLEAYSDADWVGRLVTYQIKGVMVRS